MAERIVNLPGATLTGGMLVLDGTIQQVSTHPEFLLNVTLQTPDTNAGDVWLYDTGGHRRIGFITAGSSLSMDIDSVRKIYVEGSRDDVVYWIGLTTT